VLAQEIGAEFKVIDIDEEDNWTFMKKNSKL
jgi:hypothetical protein